MNGPEIFNFTIDELQDKLSVDENQAKRILDLTKRNYASHSAWLMFMFSRLQLAKDLLTDDGVIFISIDSGELSYLQVLLDSVFNLYSSSALRRGVTTKGSY